MPQAAGTIEVGIETATSRGWLYEVTVTSRGTSTNHDISLSWHDHDYWCGGALAPSRLVERLLALLTRQLGKGAMPESLPQHFDCSTARRWLPDLDDLLRHGSAGGGPESGMVLPG
ncbi:MAG: hypothetical protein NCW75_11325 [Phycisphaera sp.]|nr:MAG: hypothetical protein NCW75_11325 [Phycisphaera sp.]